MINKRVEELQEYFKGHSKSKEQKAHTSKVQKNWKFDDLDSFYGSEMPNIFHRLCPMFALGKQFDFIDFSYLPSTFAENNVNFRFIL